jgi:hypothetical protein
VALVSKTTATQSAGQKLPTSAQRNRYGHTHAQRRLPKLQRTAHKRRHRTTGESGKGRRMPRTKIGTDNSPEE